MNNLGFTNLIFILSLSFVFGYFGVSSAEIYKYRDAEGNWVFTDRDSQVPSDAESVKPVAHRSDLIDLRERVESAFPPRNEIENARNATVLIETSTGHGTGFFINERGYLLTNRHVVDNTSGVFQIQFIDGTRVKIYGAKVSHKHDVALLRLTGYKCPSVAIGDPHSLPVGTTVYAIGNPSTMLHSVTSGIFSGYREYKAGKIYMQTNSQINPGNSGGPLVNADGKVLGINTWKLAGVGVEGLGFAIPVDIALEEFRKYLD
jgi:S1-C subfamily serine protease